MKILYNQQQTKRALIFGIIWVALGATSYVVSSNTFSFPAFLGIGVFYIILYFIQKNIPYVQITPSYIQVHSFIRKRIKLTEISEVKYFAGDYIITGRRKQITIDTNLIDKQSLPELTAFMENLMKAKV